MMRKSVGCAIEYYKHNYNLSEDAIKRFEKYEKDININKVNMYPYVYEICKFIVENGGKNFIFTHRDNIAIKYLKSKDIDKFFRECITRESGFNAKPSPDAIIYLLNKYNMDSRKTLMIGDRDIDILSGKNAGIKSVFFKWNEIENNFEVADYNICNLKEIESIVKD